MKEFEIKYKTKRIITRNGKKESIYDDIIIRVGDGMIMQVGSNCYPYTVTKLISPKKIEIQEDNTEPDHTPNPNGRKKIISLRRKGLVWKQVNTNYPYFYPRRNFYQDPSF
jgi:hypothetical protein